MENRIKILANDGIASKGIALLEKSGFEVITTKVAQEQVANYINKNNIEVLLVRSATKVTSEIIDSSPSLKVIGRGGTGMDNIEVTHAREKQIHVINTPDASSESVAELVFAHLFTGVRFLQVSNRDMPLDGDTRFANMKKALAGGTELKGKTIGIIGFGKIGKSVARMALGLGMKVIAADKFVGEAVIKVEFYNGQFINVDIKTEPLEQLLQHSDFITVHVPHQDNYLIGKAEIDLMKDNAGIINAARGGIIDEVALLDALDSNKLAFAGLDVFENEPSPEIKILMHPKISLTPHIGAATVEAQERIGISLANQIISLLKNQ